MQTDEQQQRSHCVLTVGAGAVDKQAPIAASNSSLQRAKIVLRQLLHGMVSPTASAAERGLQSVDA